MTLSYLHARLPAVRRCHLNMERCYATIAPSSFGAGVMSSRHRHPLLQPSRLAFRTELASSPLVAPRVGTRQLSKWATLFAARKRRHPCIWLGSCGIMFSFIERGKLGRFSDIKDLRTLLSHPKEWEELDVDPIKKAKIREAMYICPLPVDAHRASMLDVTDWKDWFDYYLQQLYMGYFSPNAIENAPVVSPLAHLFYPSSLLHRESFTKLKDAVLMGGQVIALNGPHRAGKTTAMLELRDDLIENHPDLIPFYLDFDLLTGARSDAVSTPEALSERVICERLCWFLEKSLERSFGLRVTNYLSRDYPALFQSEESLERAQTIMSVILSSCESTNKRLVLLIDHGYDGQAAHYLPHFRRLLNRFVNQERDGVHAVVYTDHFLHSAQRDALEPAKRLSGAFQHVAVDWRPTLAPEGIEQVMALLKESLPEDRGALLSTPQGISQSARELHELTGGIVWMVNGMLTRRLDPALQDHTWKDLALQFARDHSHLVRGNTTLPSDASEAASWNVFKKSFLDPAKYRIMHDSGHERVSRYYDYERGLFHTDVSGALHPNCYIAMQSVFDQILRQDSTQLSDTHAEYYQAAEWFIVKAHNCSQMNLEYHWDENQILWGRSDHCNEAYALLPMLRLSEKEAIFKYVTPWIERRATSNGLPDRVRFFIANGKMDRQTVLTRQGYIELEAL